MTSLELRSLVSGASWVTFGELCMFYMRRFFMSKQGSFPNGTAAPVSWAGQRWLFRQQIGRFWNHVVLISSSAESSRIMGRVS